MQYEREYFLNEFKILDQRLKRPNYNLSKLDVRCGEGDGEGQESFWNIMCKVIFRYEIRAVALATTAGYGIGA